MEGNWRLGIFFEEFLWALDRKDFASGGGIGWWEGLEVMADFKGHLRSICSAKQDCGWSTEYGFPTRA